MTQRASEAPRKGKTEQEDRLEQAFIDMRISAKRDQVLCFTCGKYDKNPQPTQYPKQCTRCGHKFSEPLDHCIPDIVVENHGQVGIVFVQRKWGAKAPHSKDRVKKKDIHQIEKMEYWGYKAFVVHNELVDNAEKTWLRAVAHVIYLAIGNGALYLRLHDGEKELVGLG